MRKHVNTKRYNLVSVKTELAKEDGMAAGEPFRIHTGALNGDRFLAEVHASEMLNIGSNLLVVDCLSSVRSAHAASITEIVHQCQ
jgi:hypothetical protein